MPNKHGGKREGAGRPRSNYMTRNEKLSFKNEAERRDYMSVSPRQRVLLVLNSLRCDECGRILDILPDGWRICNQCS